MYMKSKSLRVLLSFLIVNSYLFINPVSACGYPGSPAHANIKFAPEHKESGPYSPGSIAIYTCDNGYDLLGPGRRTCYENGTWQPPGVPFCVLNVAVGKAAMQSSGSQQGTAQRAVDGNTSEKHNEATCTATNSEVKPWWYVNLLEPYLVQLVRINFGRSCCGQQPAIVTVRVGNHRPDMASNPVCNKFVGFIEAGAPLYLPCARPLAGAFVSVHIESSNGKSIQLSICETFVYTDHALSIEQCPSFRDQPLGSTSTYNGKCYTFYNDKVETFDNAKRFCERRGGTLVDNTSPALHGFLSWELYRKHRNSREGQYWLGAVRDANKNWKWINGKDVTISFWGSPRGSGNCSRLDGVRGWMWDATSCTSKLHFVCQLRPLACGRPEIPVNSTILYRKLDIGAQIEYRCTPGTLLVGPSIRTCLETGFFSDYAPKCKYLECGSPASIADGEFKFLNGTKSFQSIVQYSCKEGYAIVGRSALSCDVDGRWNGPPPRCQPLECGPPVEIENGLVETSNKSTIVGTRAFYSCKPDYELEGDAVLICGKNGFWEGILPLCRSKTTTHHTTTSTSTTSSTTSTTRSPTPPTRRFPYSSSPRHPPPSVYPSSREPSRRPSNELTTSSPRPPTTRANVYTRLTAISSRRPSPSTHQSPSSSDSPSSKPGVMYSPTTLSPPTSPTRKKVDIPMILDHDQDNEISDSRSSKRANLNMKAAATTKLNMGGIIALGVFGGFVFLAAITTIVIIIFRRLRNSRSSIDAQTISTFDSSGDQNGFYRNYKESWENLKYVRHNSSFKPNINRLDAFDTNFGQNTRTQRGICNEGFRDLNEITLNADVAALYTRPEKQSRHGRR